MRDGYKWFRGRVNAPEQYWLAPTNLTYKDDYITPAVAIVQLMRGKYVASVFCNAICGGQRIGKFHLLREAKAAAEALAPIYASMGTDND